MRDQGNPAAGNRIGLTNGDENWDNEFKLPPGAKRKLLSGAVAWPRGVSYCVTTLPKKKGGVERRKENGGHVLKPWGIQKKGIRG